jgi:hypothetical protein
MVRESLLFLSAAALFALDPRVQTGYRQIRVESLRADLTFLCSDALEGRLALRRGDEAAIEFIAAEFAKAGLKPAFGDSYIQRVPLIEYRTDRAGSLFTLHSGGASKQYRYGAGFSGGGARDANLKAGVVFAGYGITAPEFGYDDYAGVDARGKIVLAFEHEPQETDPRSVFNGTGNTRHANNYVKLLNAQKHGAVALLVASEPNRKHPSTAQRMLMVPNAAERMRKILPQALVESEARIPMFTVTDEVLAALIAPTGRTPSALQSSIDAALRPASTALAGVSLDIRLSIASATRGRSANVAAILEGSDAALRNQAILYTAHHDHDGDWGGEIHPGADDNGSGSVGVMALARAFAANPARPKRSMIFAVFTAEERGLLGAYHFAAHPPRPLASIKAVVNFDMIGRDEAPSPQTNGLMEVRGDTRNQFNLVGAVNSPTYRAAVERANQDVGLQISYKWDDDTALAIFQRSDHFPFVLHDIPALWWFTGFHPDYHQTTDTVDKINFEKMAKILRLAYLTGWRFGDDARTPVYVASPGTAR